MIDLVTYLTAGWALIFGLYKFAAGRGADASPEARGQVLLALSASGDLGLAAPATVALVDRLGSPCAALVSMFDDDLRIVAVRCFALLAFALLPLGAERRRAELRQRRATGATIAAATVLFFAARADVVSGHLVVRGTGVLALAAYVVLVNVYTIWWLGTAAVVITRHARRIEPRALRVGPRFLAAAAVIMACWGLWYMHDAVAVLRTGQGKTAVDAADTGMGALGIGLAIVGATVVTWYGAGRGPARWLRCYRQYRALGQLWSALRVAVPAIVLDPVSRRHLPDLPLDAEFALHRRIIEIYDGRLALRPHFHPEVPAWAGAALLGPSEEAGANADKKTAATIEAAVIAAAIEAARLGHPVGEKPAAPSLAPTELHSTAEETAWLLEVANAFGTSPVVAQIRDRVRAEPAT